VQGRFTGADPYDINIERQETADRDEANDLFRNYIEQPQHWNHYVYALNNPLKYVDPDGWLEYETELLGKKIKVKISDEIGKKEQDAIRKNIDSAIAKINDGADKLTSEQTKAINSMNGIEVGGRFSRSGMDPNRKVFLITERFAKTQDLDWLTGAIIHDSYHADQMRRGEKYSGLDAERRASAFAADVAERIGLNSATIKALNRDAIEGHPEPPFKILQKSRPPKKKSP